VHYSSVSAPERRLHATSLLWVVIKKLKTSLSV
jgi:hypothetical protein